MLNPRRLRAATPRGDAHSLRLEGDAVRGAIAADVTSMRLDALTQQVVAAQRADEKLKAG